jgi:hypothetical protein
VYFTNPLGGLRGKAYTGVDRFNRRSSDGVAIMVQPGNAEGNIYELNAETVAHEVGHSLGLRHIDPAGSIEIMDYQFTATEAERFSDQPFNIKEKPMPGGKVHSERHNPVYHLKRYVEGASPSELATMNLVAGEWDQEGGLFSAISSDLSFTLRDGTSAADFTLYDAYVLATEGDPDESRTLDFFPQITLADLASKSFELLDGDGIEFFASSAPGADPDIVLATGSPFDDQLVFPEIGNVSALLQMVDSSTAGYRTLADVIVTAEAVPEPDAELLIALAAALGFVMRVQQVKGKSGHGYHSTARNAPSSRSRFPLRIG